MPELKPPFTVVCIDDRNRPQEIPPHKWIEKDQTYTVVKVGRTMDNQIGFVLEEIELGDDTFPYDLFHSRRFGIPKEDETLAEEAVEELLGETIHELELT